MQHRGVVDDDPSDHVVELLTEQGLFAVVALHEITPRAVDAALVVHSVLELRGRVGRVLEDQGDILIAEPLLKEVMQLLRHPILTAAASPIGVKIGVQVKAFTVVASGIGTDERGDHGGVLDGAVAGSGLNLEEISHQRVGWRPAAAAGSLAEAIGAHGAGRIVREHVGE